MTPWSLYRDRFPEIHGVANPQLDVIQQYFPWRMFAAEALREGVVPLWNPHAYCGQPFVANVLSAVFYPFTWLALAVPIAAFFLLSAWFHLTLLGTGMWLLLRRHGLGPPAAATGAVVSMLNGFVVGWLAYANLSQWTYAWAPLLLWVWRAAFDDRRPARLGWTALILAMVACGGHVQIAFYVGLCWVIYAAGTAIGARRYRDLVLYVAAPAGLALLLSAPQLGPAFEMAYASGRTGAEYRDAVALRMPAWMLGLLVMPWFYGHNALHLMTGSGLGGPYYWGDSNAIEMSISPGATAFVLAIFGLVERRDRSVWIFATMALLGVLLALGTPVYWLFFKLVPAFSSLRGLSRAFAMVDLGVAALAAYGVQALLSEVRPPGRGRAAAVAGLVVAGLVLQAWVHEALRSAPDRLTAFTPGSSVTPNLTSYALWQTAIAAAVTGAVLLVAVRGRPAAARWLPLLALAELGGLGFRQHPGAEPGVFFFETPETRYLESAPEPGRLVGYPAGDRPWFLDWMPMNTPMAYGLSSPCGSESLSFDAYTRVLREFWDQETFTPRLGHPLLDFVGARYVLSRADLTGRHDLRRVAGERCGVYENPHALPLVFVTSRWRTGPAASIESLVAEPGYDPREVLLPPAAPDAPEAAVTNQERASCYVDQPTPQRCVARVSSPSATMVVRSTVAAPGWRATVDGRPAVSWLANRVFQAVAAPPGAVTVRWVYRPSGYVCGLFAGLVGVMLLAATAVAGPGKRTG